MTISFQRPPDQFLEIRIDNSAIVPSICPNTHKVRSWGGNIHAVEVWKLSSIIINKVPPFDYGLLEIFGGTNGHKTYDTCFMASIIQPVKPLAAVDGYCYWPLVEIPLSLNHHACMPAARVSAFARTYVLTSDYTYHIYTKQKRKRKRRLQKQKTQS